MPEPVDQTKVTALLGQIREGDAHAENHLLEMVYGELRTLAGALHAPNRLKNTLQPTALVHEAWMKMVGKMDGLESRSHFMAVAAKAMRQVLADRAKAATRQKRGGGTPTVCFEDKVMDVPDATGDRGIDLVALDHALTKLLHVNERHACVVEMRIFGLMTTREIADRLGVTRRTVEKDWNFARLWLRAELMAEEF